MKYFLLLFLMCLSTLASQAKTPSSDEVKVISYNIRFANKKDGANIWQNRAKASPAMIRDYAPDVFGVQEALAEQLEYMDVKLPQYSYVGVGREDGKKKGKPWRYSIIPARCVFWIGALTGCQRLLRSRQEAGMPTARGPRRGP